MKTADRRPTPTPAAPSEAARAPSPASQALAESPRMVAQRQAVAAAFGGGFAGGFSRDRAAPASVVQREPDPDAATPPTPMPKGPTGTLDDVVKFATHPGAEPNKTLAAAMGLWGRYGTRVTPGKVKFALLPDSEKESHLDSDHHIGGRSHWDGNTPVIELPQAVLDDIAAYLAVRANDAVAKDGDTETPGDEAEAAAARGQRAPLERAHEAVRLLGHEMHHLWRTKEGDKGNPLQQPWEKESARRMDEVRANWVAWLQDAPAASLRYQGIPAATKIKTWKDVPAKVQKDIEEGAAKTDYIEGLYQRSTYLVEEIYTKVEELSYLRVQQRDDTASVRQPSLNEVTQLATLVGFLSTTLRNQVTPDGLITPALYLQTQTAMLAYLRQRFPAAAGKQYDSYEVVFFLSARAHGLPPLYSDGKLISTVPDARVPP